MGEMLDSLALDHITGLTMMLVLFIKTVPNAHLMLLTKSCNIENLLSVEANDNVVVSWSLNSRYAIRKYEIGTASLKERINAARLSKEHGYRIRFRIDPGILHPGWQSDYAQLAEMAASLEPENITLGMLRLLPGHKKLATQTYIKHAKELNMQQLSDTGSDRKKRYPAKDRIGFYRFMLNCLGGFKDKLSVSLCRETPDVWDELAHLCQPNQCNCITW